MPSREIKVRLKGISPLLMHRFPLMPIEDPPLDKRKPEEQAELAAYRDAGKKLYVPALALQRALVGSATYSKGKGRASLQKSAAACLSIMPMYLVLDAQTYEVDAQRVVIPATKGAVIRYRPRFDSWQIEFTLGYDENLLTENQCRTIVDDAGSRVGILDYRPEKKGPFGRFMVTKWELVPIKK